MLSHVDRFYMFIWFICKVPSFSAFGGKRGEVAEKELKSTSVGKPGSTSNSSGNDLQVPRNFQVAKYRVADKGQVPSMQVKTEMLR